MKFGGTSVEDARTISGRSSDWVRVVQPIRAVLFEFTLTLIGQFLVSRCAADRAVPPDGGKVFDFPECSLALPSGCAREYSGGARLTWKGRRR